MSLPPKPFYTLDETAARRGCMPRDIAGWAAAGGIEIVSGIAPTQCEGGVKAGIVKVPIADLIPLFRACVGGSEELPIGRIAEIGSDRWALVLEPGGLAVARDDLRISRAEVTRFEDQCGILGRGGGNGPAPKYDWDAFYRKMIVRLFRDGLPETQSHLVGEMQEWFAATAGDGEMPDESTIRRRISPIWRELQRV